MIELKKFEYCKHKIQLGICLKCNKRVSTRPSSPSKDTQFSEILKEFDDIFVVGTSDGQDILDHYKSPHAYREFLLSSLTKVYDLGKEEAWKSDGAKQYIEEIHQAAIKETMEKVMKAIDEILLTYTIGSSHMGNPTINKEVFKVLLSKELNEKK